MRTLRGQFILSHILPFLVILPIAGLAILYLIETQVMLRALAVDLEERAALIAQAVARQPETVTDAGAARLFLADLEPLIHGEVYLLDADGDLLAADTELHSPPDTGLANRAAGGTVVSVAYNLAGNHGEAVAPVVDVNEQLIGLVGVRESLTGVAESFGLLRRLVSITVLGGMALGALAGVLLARRLAGPIDRTAAAVSGIAAGERTAPLADEGPAELRQLAAAVNTLAARLRSLEEMRRRSFANIVHELGRPLGAVLAAVQVLRGGAGDDPAVRAELLAGVHKELAGMEPLLDDLAQLHADAAGSRRLDRRATPLAAWLSAALPPWREAALTKGLAWIDEIPADLPEVEIDTARMAQVIGNLLSNAVKYTELGGVAVSATAGESEINIAVSDTGPGIPQQEQELIFEPFYRGQPTGRLTEGLGVGLSIARGLTEAHGGRLTLESAPGRGSVFTVHLPIR